jgi:3-oxoacyl-[acyl-carrier protein] reductase
MSRSKTVFLTGGARGIGAAIRQELKTSGYQVVAPSRQELDLSDPRLVERFLADYQGPAIDILINNAGENPISTIDSLSDEAWSRTLMINLTAPMMLIRHFSQRMRQKGWGRIVNVSSCYSLVAREGRAPYTASKAGLNGLTRTTALELAANGILVNSVCPGFVATDLTLTNNTDEQIRDLVAQIPIGRLADPFEIARFVIYLATEQNAYITGQTMIIDGGFMIR